jgi:hypothetical protein
MWKGFGGLLPEDLSGLIHTYVDLPASPDDNSHAVNVRRGSGFAKFCR